MPEIPRENDDICTSKLQVITFFSFNFCLFSFRRANYSEQISSPPKPPIRISPKTSWKEKSQSLLLTNSPNSSTSRHLRSGSVSSSTSSASMGSSGFISAGQDMGSSESQEYRQSRTVHLKHKRRSVILKS